MTKLNPQVDIAVLKEQITQLTSGMKDLQSDITIIKDKLDDTYVRKVDNEIAARANQDTHVDIDRRLRSLENWRWYIVGALAIVGFSLILFVSYK